MGRRTSIHSASSSSSLSSSFSDFVSNSVKHKFEYVDQNYTYENDKKDKKDKDKKHKDGKSKGSHGLFGFNIPGASGVRAALGAVAGGSAFAATQGDRSSYDAQPHGQASFPQPPAYTAAPPSGYRIPLTSQSAFPAPNQLGPPPCMDMHNEPLYFGSAIFERSVHPCKIGQHLQGYVAVSYGGQEIGAARYDLLPFDPNTMELVHASKGQIPPGRHPIEGGYEENGEILYHAVGYVNGFHVPGKTGLYLRGANVPWGGGEHCVPEYQILCWK